MTHLEIFFGPMEDQGMDILNSEMMLCLMVNHHGQTILFGGALLENGKEETFLWLFEHFLKYMFNNHPSTMKNDQDKAIGNAIKKFFQTLDIAIVHGILRSMSLDIFDR
uniref:MULE transposase domain-containing protein n=1 Tax=Lactuca sativa TaxID=4236 RepID=A0A9R1WJK5_LACSA|nr:hypothetical protein LSAT_V11C200075570 [Lactuca sativa]